MKRLRFRLERVLALRRMTERQAAGEFALQRRAAEEAEVVATAARAAAQAALAQLADTSAVPHTHITGERVVRAFDIRARDDGQQAALARGLAEEAAHRWRARRIESEAIARLKQRAATRYVHEFEAAEERERDERAAVRRAIGTADGAPLKESGEGHR